MPLMVPTRLALCHQIKTWRSHYNVSMSKRALLLLNKKARQGRSDLSACLERLRQGGLELIPAAKHRDASEVVRRHRNDVDLVIVAGGDGSLNAAAEGLVDTQLPLGVL